MAHAAPTGLVSIGSWAILPEDEPGEWVDGQLVEEEMASHIHEAIVGFLIASLRAWALPRRGFVGGSSAKFAVSATRGRRPDVYAYLDGRRPPARAAVTTLPPDLAVEVISATPKDARRDRIEKLAEYAAFGVRLYWLIDPELRTFEAHELGADGRYVHALGASEGTIAVPGCDGLSLDLDALWAEVNRLLEPES